MHLPVIYAVIFETIIFGFLMMVVEYACIQLVSLRNRRLVATQIAAELNCRKNKPVSVPTLNSWSKSFVCKGCIAAKQTLFIIATYTKKRNRQNCMKFAYWSLGKRFFGLNFLVLKDICLSEDIQMRECWMRMLCRRWIIVVVIWGLGLFCRYKLC